MHIIKAIYYKFIEFRAYYFSKNPRILRKQQAQRYDASKINQNGREYKYDPKYEYKIPDSILRELWDINAYQSLIFVKLIWKEKYVYKLLRQLASMSSNVSECKKKFNPPKLNQNYRTFMCQQFEEERTWIFKDKCCYAHGDKELRKLNDPYPKEYLKHVEFLRK